MTIMPYGWPWPIDAVHRPGRLLAPHRVIVTWVMKSSGISLAAPDHPRNPAAVTSPEWLWLTL